MHEEKPDRTERQSGKIYKYSCVTMAIDDLNKRSNQVDPNGISLYT
jgi:hypothetical protein